MDDDRLWKAMGRTPFVALTTYRRSGAAVTTPVWIAPDGEALVVTSERSTGKVKRIRNGSHVRMQPCSRMGKVRPGAPALEGEAEILGPPERHPTATRALARKYRLQYTLVLAVERLVRRRQGKPGDRVIIRITTG